MKMVMAIVRPNTVLDVTKALEEAGYLAATKWGVSGRGKQRGIQVGDVVYEEMAKTSLMVVCDDDSKNEVIDIIMQSALTGESGNPGDGRIFVLPVEESYTISEQAKDEE
ncbi:MAG: P-II family nitrogen regulator [Eubacteriales bacterium]